MKQPTYDAGDLHDAYALAHESTEWLLTLIGQMSKEAKRLQGDLEGKGIHSAHFYTLNKLMDLTEFMAEERTNYLDIEQEKYKIEHEKIQKTQQAPELVA